MNSVVIGSGFGGIAAALRLRDKTHKVTLVEKHNDLGGRARVFKKNGFTFDAGPTVITAPHLINELFGLFNKKSQDYIKIKPLSTWYRFIFEDGLEFDYSGDEQKMKSQIAIKINHFLKKRLIEFSGLLLMFFSIFLLASIFTYSPSDPNFIYSPENIKGIFPSFFRLFLIIRGSVIKTCINNHHILFK